MADERLLAIYASLPDIDCTGRCFQSCGIIGIFGAERQHMRRQGITPPEITDLRCPHLDFAGRCSIHEHRPIVCRLYGVTEKLRCPFGCKPERMLTEAEGSEIMQRVQAIGPPEDPETLLLAKMLADVARSNA